MKKVFISLFIITVIISGCSFVNKSAGSNTAPLVDSRIRVKAADFDLKALDGQKVKLSNLRGKVVIINFFTTWCTYCKAEMPGFVDTMEKMKNNKNVKFLFVDVEESQNVVSKFIKQKKFEAANPLLDLDGKVFTTYGGSGFPTTYIIDKKGNISYTQIGLMEIKDLKREINTALGS